MVTEIYHSTISAVTTDYRYCCRREDFSLLGFVAYIHILLLLLLLLTFSLLNIYFKKSYKWDCVKIHYYKQKPAGAQEIYITMLLTYRL